MKVFITGIGGFLGSHLARALEQRGHQVQGSTIRLGQPVDPALFQGIDALIHAAHDFRPRSMNTNLTGARLFFDAARGRHRILVSSHSARPDAVSEYGISKYRIERLWLDAGETVVRPGLVLGDGGVFGRYLATIRKSRLIPLVDGGRDLVPIVAISDLCEAMVQIVEGSKRSPWNLFNQTEPAMRQIVETALQLEGRRAWIVPLPYPVALGLVRAAETLGLPLPLQSGSIQTVRLNRNRLFESNLSELLGSELSLEEALRTACVRL